MRIVRVMVTLFVALVLGFGTAPAAAAAESPSITFTVSGASGATVQFCPWTGTSYDCAQPVEAYPTKDVPKSVLLSELAAGTRYAVKVIATKYWTLWWHQSGPSATAATGAAGDHITAGTTSINLGTFNMTLRRTVSGTVRDGAGTALPGIGVGIYTSAIDASARTALAATTTGTGDDKPVGEFDLVIPYGPSASYLLGFYDPSGIYAAKTQSEVLGSGDLSIDVTMSLAKANAPVSGQVALAGTEDASGVVVEAYAWTGSSWAPVESTLSAADGSYGLDIENNKTFTLKFAKDGFAARWLGGGSSMPSNPTATNSRVASGTVSLPSVSLPVWVSAFKEVAGQEVKVNGVDICEQSTLPASGEPQPLPLGFTAKLYGKSGNQIYVTDQGFAYLSDTKLASMAEGGFPDLTKWNGAPIFAPLWFDSDLSGGAADSVTYGFDDAADVACVRWNDLGRYSGNDSDPNTFQLIIRSQASAAGRSPGDFDLTFNYDQVLWAGQGEGSASIGYTAGDRVAGHLWVYPRSTTAAVDGGTFPLIAGSADGSTPGRYIFEIHNALLNTAAPTIIGTPTSGSQLQAEPGTWSPAATYRYQWSLDGQPGPTSSTYQVPANSQHKVIGLTVTATAPGLSEVSVAAAPVTVLETFTKRPTPTISGKAKVGSTLSMKTGTWSPKATLSRQWLRNGVAIPGATGSKYKVKLDDVGAKLTVRVTAVRSGFLSVAKTSKATKTVPKVPLKASTPKISGTAKVGRTLTLSTGRWTSGATLAYRWYRSGKLISGASSRTYLLQAADKGKKITVKVTGSKPGYTTVSKTSKATKKVS